MTSSKNTVCIFRRKVNLVIDLLENNCTKNRRRRNVKYFVKDHKKIAQFVRVCNGTYCYYSKFKSWLSLTGDKGLKTVLYKNKTNCNYNKQKTKQYHRKRLCVRLYETILILLLQNVIMHHREKRIHPPLQKILILLNQSL